MSGFHKLTTTIFRKTISEGNAKKIFCRDYKPFDHKRLQSKLTSETVTNYSQFQSIFLETLNHIAPVKMKILRFNNNPFMNQTLRKVIMTRLRLKKIKIKIALQKNGTAIKNKDISALSYYLRLRKNNLIL